MGLSVKRTGVLFGLMLLIFAPLRGQVIDKGAISGTVVDPSGAVVPGVSVTITHVATGATRTVLSGDDGRYTAQLLSPGDYTVTVSLTGFATTLVRDVRLAVGQHLIQDVSLQLAAVGETVEVRAVGGPVDRGEPLVNSVVNQAYVEELPVAGRDFRDFVNLAPTAQETPGLRSPIRLGGQFGEYTGFLIDGVDNRNSFFGEWFGSLETKNFTVPQDAVQEFQVRATGFSAEFGHSTGGLINVVTKSGSNHWHGTAHWFFQSDELVRETTVPAFRDLPPPANKIRPSFNTRHQFGATLGGPISRDKAFFFFALDAQQQEGPLTIRFSRDPKGVAVPEFGISDLSALQGEFDQSQDLVAPLLRFDWNLAQGHTATTRLNYTRNDTTNFTGGRGQLIINAAESNLEDFVNEGFAVSQSLTSVLAANTLNEFRFAFSREMRPRRAKGAAPETIIFDTGNFNQRFFLPIDSDHKRLQIIDNFSRTFGDHDLKLGVDLNSNANSQIFIGFASGAYFFGSLEDFVKRTPLFALQLVGINGFDAVESGTVPTFWQKELAFYVQDNWKVIPRLTLNLGVRWDGVWNPQPQFTPIPGKVVPYGKARRAGDKVEFRTGPVPQTIPNDFNNWAPRVGVAYDLLGNGKSIIRGGVGVYYAVLPSIFMAEMLSGTGRRGAQVFLPFFGSKTDLTGLGLSYPQKLPSKATPSVTNLLGPPLIRYADPDLESARVTNVQVGVEHQILPNFSISGTYSFNRSDNLRIGGFWNSRYDRNFLPPTRAADFDQFGRAKNLLGRGRLDSTISVADALTSFGRARFHAFILQAKKTMGRGHQFNVNYTVSKNDDNVSNDRDSNAYFAPSDPFDLDIDYGRSQLDIRHQFTAYARFLLPAEFVFSTQVRARSGVAFPAFSGFCPSGDSNKDGNCSGLTFDPDRPVVGGELLPRYPDRQPNFYTWDLRIGRDLLLAGEETRLRLTFDVFNFTNADNFFSDPLAGDNAIWGSRNYKRLDRTSGPINAQIGVKLIF